MVQGEVDEATERKLMRKTHFIFASPERLGGHYDV